MVRLLNFKYEDVGFEITSLGNDRKIHILSEIVHKYTGQERDTFTNYDYMHFRFYASSMGRFLKPDNVIPNAFNPQSWNLYTYVKGNPVNYNDPSGHFAGGFGGGITRQTMKQEIFGPPEGTIWDQAMGMFYDETIDGVYVSYSDWAVSGGNSDASGQGEEKVDPFASIPDASTLPENQRDAYVIYGVGNSKNDPPNTPGTPIMGAGEATEKLMNLGYQVHSFQFESNKQIKTMANEGLFKGAIVIISAHYGNGYFWWSPGLQRTSGSSMAKWIGLSGASNVRYLACNSWPVAEKTRQIGGMGTWGSRGLLNIKLVDVLPPPGLPISSGLRRFYIDYWFLTFR